MDVSDHTFYSFCSGGKGSPGRLPGRGRFLLKIPGEGLPGEGGGVGARGLGGVCVGGIWEGGGLI